MGFMVKLTKYKILKLDIIMQLKKIEKTQNILSNDWNI